MRKYITTGLIVLAASYSIAALAGQVIPVPPPPPPVVNGSFGNDNFTSNSTVGNNPNAGGRGPGSLAYNLHKIFFGDQELTFNRDGLLVDASGKPFTGTTATGQVFQDGKKQ